MAGEEAAKEEDKLARLEAEENNPMKALENRTLDSKREMEVLDALQDIRARNARNERVANSGGIDLADKLARDQVQEEEEAAKRLEDEEDEKLVREVFSRVSESRPGPSRSPDGESNVANGEASSPVGPTVTVKRKADGAEPELLSLLSDNAKSLLSKTSAPAPKRPKVGLSNSLGIKIVKKGKAPVKQTS